MNFIDRTLELINDISADDFIQAMADIYSEPIERSELKKYPQFVQDIIFIIDYDTELQMEGLDGFLNNSTGKYVNETILALKNCGAIEDAAILEKCKNIINEDEFILLEQKIYLNNDFERFWNSVNGYVEAEKCKQHNII